MAPWTCLEACCPEQRLSHVKTEVNNYTPIRLLWLLLQLYYKLVLINSSIKYYILEPCAQPLGHILQDSIFVPFPSLTLSKFRTAGSDGYQKMGLQGSNPGSQAVWSRQIHWAMAAASSQTKLDRIFNFKIWDPKVPFDIVLGWNLWMGLLKWDKIFAVPHPHWNQKQHPSLRC